MKIKDLAASWFCNIVTPEYLADGNKAAWKRAYELAQEKCAHELQATEDFKSAVAERKIVQIAEGAMPAAEGIHGPESWTTALCNDGTVWQLFRNKWELLPPIPQGDAP